MALFKHMAYDIDRDSEEHLYQADFDCTYEAIKACLDPERRLDYLRVHSAVDDRFLMEVSPYAVWGSLEAFEERIGIYVRSIQVQLNLDVTPQYAAERLMISHIETTNNRLAMGR